MNLLLKFLQLPWYIKQIIVFGLIIFTMTGTTVYLLYENKKLNDDLKVSNNNVLALNDSLTTIKDKDGSTHKYIRSLEYDKKTLKQTQSELLSQLDNMRIKVKNVKNTIRTTVEYQYKTDTVFSTNTIITPIDTVFQTELKDKWFNAKWNTKVIIDSIQNKRLQITDYQTNFNDSLLFVTETKYKRVWLFWRKPKYVRIHVKSANPYSNVKRVEHIEFK